MHCLALALPLAHRPARDAHEKSFTAPAASPAGDDAPVLYNLTTFLEASQRQFHLHRHELKCVPGEAMPCLQESGAAGVRHCSRVLGTWGMCIRLVDAGEHAPPPLLPAPAMAAVIFAAAGTVSFVLSRVALSLGLFFLERR